MRWMAMLALAALMVGVAVEVSHGLGLQTVASVANAEEGGAEAEVVRQRTWWDSVRAAGWVGAIIFLVSIAALALIIQYSVEQKAEKLLPPHLVTELEQLFEEQAYDEAAELCQTEDCYFTRIVGAGLSKMEGGYDAIIKAIETAGDEETGKLFGKLSNLSLMVAVAPMLGLYGTVTGMIAAFNVIASTAGGATPAQLADGISEALVTTFLGLTVAIPTSVAFHFLKSRVVRISMETGGIVGDLFERFRQPAA